MGDSAVHIVVHGSVQGVFFRASTQSQASEHSLTGWVRNLSDGTVEIHAEGDKESLDRFIEWCRQGPPTANVQRLDLDWVASQSLSDFEVR
ncbi:MAG: acylphosphatase [Nitrospinaceae bacterium]|jgi:acylphosphatase|nr:acylphosphatase [Nitrospinaceae bacterium]|tara:strand:- start:190 stop:462 length:273 start_codon:yes stop_codon:yes gene_type:complete